MRTTVYLVRVPILFFCNDNTQTVSFCIFIKIIDSDWSLKMGNKG